LSFKDERGFFIPFKGFHVADQLKDLLGEAEKSIGSASDLRTLEDLRVKYLGKNGLLTEFLRSISKLPESERPEAGRACNEAKNKIAALLGAKIGGLEDRDHSAPAGWDSTLPGRALPWGKTHPLVSVQKGICEIFAGLGFQTVNGPDVETDYYNFQSLNFHLGHPARDAHDTFYMDGGFLLRTHTTPVQVRVMESHKPPFNIVAPGRVYRNEAVDATHHHVFHQVDGFLVDKDVHFGHLKGILDAFAKKFFGAKIETRFRPSFFPFTEPSAEVDISCVFCRGKGCRICKQSGWVEIMGCGMIHPSVFENCRLNPEDWTGFAFGMGVERVAMFKYDIDDVRLFYQNDLRFLSQF